MKNMFTSTYIEALEDLKAARDKDQSNYNEENRLVLVEAYKKFLKESINQLVYLRCSQGLRDFEMLRDFSESLKNQPFRKQPYMSDDKSSLSSFPKFQEEEDFHIIDGGRPMIPCLALGRIRTKSCDEEDGQSPDTNRSCRTESLVIEPTFLPEIATSATPLQKPPNQVTNTGQKREDKKRSKRLKKLKEAQDLEK